MATGNATSIVLGESRRLKSSVSGFRATSVVGSVTRLRFRALTVTFSVIRNYRYIGLREW